MSSSSLSSRFTSGAVVTRDRSVLLRLDELENEHAVVAEHRRGLRQIGSDFTFVRRISVQDCSEFHLPRMYAGSTLGLVRLHPHLEATFSIFAEMPVIYSPFSDLQGRFVQALPLLLQLLPPERRNVERHVFCIYAGRVLADQVQQHSTPELRLVRLPDQLGAFPNWGEALLGAVSDVLFSTDLYSREGYVVGEQFFGRKKVILQLQSNIRNHRVSGLFGLRKTGKTSVLKQLVSERSEGDCLVYRDLENLESVRFGNPIPALIVALSDDIRSGLKEVDGWVQSLAEFIQRVGPGATPSIDDFDRALRTALSNKKNRGLRLVLILDEIEHLLPADMKEIPVGAAQDDVARFFSCLRAIWQSFENFDFILAGVTAAAFENSELYGRSNPLFKIASPVWLAALNADESAQLLTSIGSRQGMQWQDDARALAFATSGGHPMLLRQLGSSVFDALPAHRTEGVVVTRGSVESGLQGYRQKSANVVREILDHIERFYPDDFEILGDLVDGLSVQDAVELSPGSIERLTQLGLIEVQDSEWEPSALLSLVAEFSGVRRLRGSERRSLGEILAGGEDEVTEFKASFAVSVGASVPADKLNWSCLRAIVSFLNGRGGVLLIGVSDNGSVAGIAPDVRVKGSRDVFVRAVNTMIKEYLGAAVYSACQLAFEVDISTGIDVLRIDVPKWREPVFLMKPHKGGGDAGALYVRNHAQTTALVGRDILKYVPMRWPG